MFDAFQKTDLLEVTWLDIVAWGGWIKATDDKSAAATCISYGFPVEVLAHTSGKQCVVLSATYSGSNGGTEFNQSMTIPIDVVMSVKKINT